ncbi:MAG TPA: hypothetical protein VFV37_09640 [Luteibaculaceae bacterium]|jgi:hypothetical protein|nr:hypothetical protein [Luteibaculaceae bacterium]
MSRRELKKAVSKDISHFAGKCLDKEEQSPLHALAVEQLLDDALDLEVELLSLISETKKYRGKEVRHHFFRLEKKWFDGVALLEKRLAELD